MKKEELEKLVDVTRKLLHEAYEGRFARWFRYLDSKSIWISSRTPMLMGAQCIRDYFEKYGTGRESVLCREEYVPFTVNSRVAVVIAKLTEKSRKAAVCVGEGTITFVYRTGGKEIKLALQQAFFESFHEERDGQRRMSGDFYTLRFVKELLLEQKTGKRFFVPSGKRALFLDLNTVLFIQSSGRKTEFHCLDCIVPCNYSISEIRGKLPGNFYLIHRRYLVNIRYITAIYRYEAELICGIRIPIPAVPYMQIKKELEEMLSGYPRQMSSGGAMEKEKRNLLFS